MPNLRVPPPIYFLIFAGLAYLLHLFFPMVSVLTWSQFFTWPFLVIGILLDFSALYLFIQNKTSISPLNFKKTKSLVISGPYRWTRNPMYLGLLSLLLAWCCWLGSLSSFITSVGFVWVVTYLQIRPEEVALKQLFGNRYIEYSKTVRRWI